MQIIKKILIANRGEIAVRIVRACRDLHIQSVAIYTEPDASCLHVKIASEAVCLGEHPIKGYLDIDAIVQAALDSKADAIHPGYGFLSENYEFARKVEEAGLIFIGPKSDAILKMGNKNIARELMKQSGIPIVPGSDVLNGKSMDEIHHIAEKIGYPVILKASGGGGGRGIKEVHSPKLLQSAYEACKREAAAYFKNDEVFMEKLIVNPRHIEFQIIGDNYGNIIHLCERDCSIQRRHQKIIEIAPCPSISDHLRRAMGVTAIAAAKAVNYCNAGTVEFLLDDDNHFYFMEMNTRIQVEHGITEEITGIDLVVRQIRYAAGEIMDIEQADIKPLGYAIEARITAENVAENFTPSTGIINEYFPALGPSVRVDSHLYKGYEVPVFYDSLLAKLMVKATSYDLAVNKLERALMEFRIDGVVNTTEFLLAISKCKEFRRGYFDTSYVENSLEQLLGQISASDEELAAISAALQLHTTKDKNEIN